MSVVFDTGEATKQVQIAIYNDPNHQGVLNFTATLHGSPGGPSIGDVGKAQVNMTCVSAGTVVENIIKTFSFTLYALRYYKHLKFII